MVLTSYTGFLLQERWQMFDDVQLQKVRAT